MSDDAPADDHVGPDLPGSASLRPAERGPAATVGLTCWWACVITAGLAVLLGVALGAVEGEGGAAWIMVMMWMVVALLTWAVGWPAGWLAEWLLDRAGVSEPGRVAVFAVLGAVLAVLIIVASWRTTGLAAGFAVAGALGAGGGRWIVAVRARRLSATTSSPA